MRKLRINVVTAIRFPKPLDILEDSQVELVRHIRLADFGPATCQRAEMNQIKAGAVVKGEQPLPGMFQWQRNVEG